VFPEVPEISGRKLVPQLAIGCFLFTLLGLLATYVIATFVTSQMKKHLPLNSPAARERENQR
jgi:hypothetical protein